MPRLGPLLICGEGRSGTTLLSVLLDSHPDIYCGPELHFRGPRDLGESILEALARIKFDPGIKPRDLNGEPDERRALQFVRRVERFGISQDWLEATVVDRMKSLGASPSQFQERAALVNELVQREARQRNAQIWGMKIMRDLKLYRDYLNQWPESLFVLILRDGRDVAASQMTDHKSWGYRDIKVAARQWTELIQVANDKVPSSSIITIKYEDLVKDPKETLLPLLDRCGLEWSDEMGRHHERDSITAVSKHHPSASQVKRPLNNLRVGRFSTDLTGEQIAQYERIAHRELRLYGYELTEDV